MAARALRIGIVAGETSGDQLGAALIGALRARCSGSRDARRVRAGRCAPAAALRSPMPTSWRSWAWSKCSPICRGSSCSGAGCGASFSPGGLTCSSASTPRSSISGLAAQLHAAGLKTVQYVSPQVWAWRERRVRGIARACDLVLCLLPFESAFYARHAVRAQFVGHPLADQIPLDHDRGAARSSLGLAADATVVALLPGSRRGEVTRLGPDFIAAAQALALVRPGVEFIAPMASRQVRTLFERQFAAGGAGAARVRMLDGQARVALQAADAALVASGTASLEALLCRCPMVVAYRLSAATAFLLRAPAHGPAPPLSRCPTCWPAKPWCRNSFRRP